MSHPIVTLLSHQEITKALRLIVSEFCQLECSMDCVKTWAVLPGTATARQNGTKSVAKQLEKHSKNSRNRYKIAPGNGSHSLYIPKMMNFIVHSIFPGKNGFIFSHQNR